MAAWRRISIGSQGVRRDLRLIGYRVGIRRPTSDGGGVEPNQGILDMAKAYYSTVFEQPAADIWEIVRDFNNYTVWVGGTGESRIEDDKSGDTVGAVRNVLFARLVFEMARVPAHGAEPPGFPGSHVGGTLGVF
jgi:hypothetical protein